VREKRIFNIEVSSEGSTVYEVSRNYSHENMYRHSPHVKQSVSISSIHRLQRIDELPPVRTLDDIRNVLGDTKDAGIVLGESVECDTCLEYPIYRNGAAPDCCSTLSTVLFDLDKKTATVYIDNPKSSPPQYTFALP
jgi:hypothetical protein